jgi:hypothetical protein
MQARWTPKLDNNDPERRRRIEEAQREVAEMEAKIRARLEEERRTGEPVRRDRPAQRIDEAE